MAGADLFDTMVFLDPRTTCIVFMVVLVLIICLEKALHWIEHEAKHYGYGDLVEKLFKELTILGLLSFATFIASESFGIDSEDDWYKAFHFSHIFLLFITLNFIVQAIGLIQLTNWKNKALVAYNSHSLFELVDEYDDMSSSKFSVFSFNNFPKWMTSNLCDAIENKICERYFIHVHHLPDHFNFTSYMHKAAVQYMIKLIEVSPSNWIVVALLILLNLVRLEMIDEDTSHEPCEYVYENRMLYLQGAGLTGAWGFDGNTLSSTKDAISSIFGYDSNSNSIGRGLGASSYETKKTLVCHDYLVYTFFVGGLVLTSAIAILLFVADHLFHRLMWRIYLHFNDICLLSEGVTLREMGDLQDSDVEVLKNGRRFYEDCLLIVAEEEARLMEVNNNISNDSIPKRNINSIHDHDINTSFSDTNVNEDDARNSNESNLTSNSDNNDSNNNNNNNSATKLSVDTTEYRFRSSSESSGTGSIGSIPDDASITGLSYHPGGDIPNRHPFSPSGVYSNEELTPDSGVDGVGLTPLSLESIPENTWEASRTLSSRLSHRMNQQKIIYQQRQSQSQEIQTNTPFSSFSARSSRNTPRSSNLSQNTGRSRGISNTSFVSHSYTPFSQGDHSPGRSQSPGRSRFSSNSSYLSCQKSILKNTGIDLSRGGTYDDNNLYFSFSQEHTPPMHNQYHHELNDIVEESPSVIAQSSDISELSVSEFNNRNFSWKTNDKNDDDDDNVDANDDSQMHVRSSSNYNNNISMSKSRSIHRSKASDGRSSPSPLLHKMKTFRAQHRGYQGINDNPEQVQAILKSNSKGEFSSFSGLMTPYSAMVAASLQMDNVQKMKLQMGLGKDSRRGKYRRKFEDMQSPRGTTTTTTTTTTTGIGIGDDKNSDGDEIRNSIVTDTATVSNTNTSTSNTNTVKASENMQKAFAFFGEVPMRRRASVERIDFEQNQDSYGRKGSNCWHYIMECVDKVKKMKGRLSSYCRCYTNKHDLSRHYSSHLNTGRKHSTQVYTNANDHNGEHHTGEASVKSSLAVDSENDDAMADLNLRLIFPRGTSTLFYKCTSLLCLLQSVFCALWATDFSSLALETDHPALWMFLLVLLIIVNFLMLFHIINVVSTIRSVTHRSIDILNEVCEEAREHSNVEENLREAITEQLKFIELPEAAWEDYVFRGFEEADQSNIGALDLNSFVTWLRLLDVHFTRKTCTRIFYSLDSNLTNSVTWNEMWRILFPDSALAYSRNNRNNSNNDDDINNNDSNDSNSYGNGNGNGSGSGSRDNNGYGKLTRKEEKKRSSSKSNFKFFNFGSKSNDRNTSNDSKNSSNNEGDVELPVTPTGIANTTIGKLNRKFSQFTDAVTINTTTAATTSNGGGDMPSSDDMIEELRKINDPAQRVSAINSLRELHQLLDEENEGNDITTHEDNEGGRSVSFSVEGQVLHDYQEDDDNEAPIA